MNTKILAFDIETDGLLDSTKILCIAAYDINTYETFFYTDIGEAIKKLNTATIVVAHNGYDFDYKIIDRLYPNQLKAARLDTKVLSQERNIFHHESWPTRASEWGDYFKLPKLLLSKPLPYKDYDPELKEYCIRDAVICGKAYLHLKDLE